ncbi:RHS repeat-associated core domain-containing protein [Superficieibacter electus]|uniref:RHS repeat-associated core domain-containing protein n=1 Tax=Superficieibacter electus TaxID=2022662 RepID=UPI00318404C5
MHLLSESANYELYKEFTKTPRHAAQPGEHQRGRGVPLPVRRLWQFGGKSYRHSLADRRAVDNIRNPLRFQGQYEDEESGLFYNLNRYYQPELGRYITSVLAD